MRILLALWFAACVAPPVLLASIDGTIVNRTSGNPQPGVAITLVKPGQGGMKTIGQTTSDASGRFAFAKDEPGGGPQLLQANYKGVNYNKLMTPNIPTSGVTLEVYEATQSAAVAHIAQQMIVLEPSSGRLAVNQMVMIQNESNTTFHNPESGGLRFYLPPAADGQVSVNAQGPQGMPLPRAAERTKESDVYKVDFPIKPGQTAFEINYVLPIGSPLSFRGRIVNVKGMPAGPLRLVAPSGVTLSGKDIQILGTEPKTKATIYNVNAVSSYTVDVAGAGSLHGPDDADSAGSDAANSNTAASDDSGVQVTQGNPQIFAHLGWLAGLAFAILAVGLIFLFRNSPVVSAPSR